MPDPDVRTRSSFDTLGILPHLTQQHVNTGPAVDEPGSHRTLRELGLPGRAANGRPRRRPPGARGRRRASRAARRVHAGIRSHTPVVVLAALDVVLAEVRPVLHLD